MYKFNTQTHRIQKVRFKKKRTAPIKLVNKTVKVKREDTSKEQPTGTLWTRWRTMTCMKSPHTGLTSCTSDGKKFTTNYHLTYANIWCRRFANREKNSVKNFQDELSYTNTRGFRTIVYAIKKMNIETSRSTVHLIKVLLTVLLCAGQTINTRTLTHYDPLSNQKMKNKLI